MANVCVLFINWFLGLVKSFYINNPNKMGLILAGPKNCGKESFFRQLLPSNLKNAYDEYPPNRGREPLFDNQILTCFSHLSHSDDKIKTLFNYCLKSPTIPRRYVKNSYMNMDRFSSFCGTIDSDQLKEPFEDGNIHIINIKGINFDIYNSIDKDKLLMEVVGMFHAALRYFS